MTFGVRDSSRETRSAPVPGMRAVPSVFSDIRGGTHRLHAEHSSRAHGHCSQLHWIEAGRTPQIFLSKHRWRRLPSKIVARYQEVETNG